MSKPAPLRVMRLAVPGGHGPAVAWILGPAIRLATVGTRDRGRLLDWGSLLG
jgi:hypothetical protein